MCVLNYNHLSVFMSGEIPPYHYGTHYSSTMIVASYLIRLEPFTQHFLRVQVMAMCSFLFSFRYTCPDVHIKTVLLLHLHPDLLTPPPLSHTYKTSFYLILNLPLSSPQGNFDLPDRLFHSVKDAWLSAAQTNMADVKELIPEFFYLPEFLTNHNKFEFGTKQNGDVIGDICLPTWAKGDPREFIRLHRKV